MAYSNNHFVPKLVLRRYDSEKLTVYDVKTGKIHKDMGLEKIFAEQDLYGEEVEKLLAKKIESPFAQILNQKLLPAKVGSEVELTRKELNIIKKFLLIEQARIFLADKEHYYTFSQKVAKRQSEIFKYPFTELEIENETVKERWLRTLRVIIECEELRKIEKHELCTNEAFYWAQIYASGYLAIWDCTDTEEEFIVTDVGMTSEREVGAPAGIERDKKDYLEKMWITENDERRKNTYFRLLYDQQTFHENFYMFSISKTRMLVIINPFFRLFDKAEKMPEPNIWPTMISRQLYAKNKAPKLEKFKGEYIYRDSDLFRYRVQKMPLEDLRWVNVLMLDRVQNILGFSDIEKIADSVCDYKDFCNNVLGCPMRVDYNPLIKYLKDNEIID
ncbi:MAG: DUF4238 domain-containing protein [Clostridia bacterium]|nr:DUF4238 domain-containing protein [Clostridia bacterium]